VPAVGYRIEVADGLSTLETVLLQPDLGDGEFTIVPLDAANQPAGPAVPLTGDAVLDLTTLDAAGIEALEIRGIEPSAELDPTDPEGFAPGFTFTGEDPGELEVTPLLPACADGEDNDGDGLVDFSGGDPGCNSASDIAERDPTPALQVEGTATGGSLTIVIGGHTLVITTAAGQSAAAIALAISDAIAADYSLLDDGVTASAAGPVLEASDLVTHFLVDDPGLTLTSLAAVPIPALPPPALPLLAGALATLAGAARHRWPFRSGAIDRAAPPRSPSSG
jgi:hypothetical protein